MHGSVELAVQIGIADVICDLVSSGATLSENGLEEFMQVQASEAILIRNSAEFNADKQKLLDRLLLRINSILNAAQSKYIMLHIAREKLPELAKILPGSEAPTILDLQGSSSKIAVHVVSQEEIFWDTLERLKAIGASSILVLPIEKMV
jgi:ATP phosphoribosyltransferase